MPQKLYFYLQLSTRHNLPDNYPLFLNDTQLFFSSTSNTLNLSCTNILNWQFHISTPTKSASNKLSVIWCLRSFFYPSQLLAQYDVIIRIKITRNILQLFLSYTSRELRFLCFLPNYNPTNTFLRRYIPNNLEFPKSSSSIHY